MRDISVFGSEYGYENMSFQREVNKFHASRIAIMVNDDETANMNQKLRGENLAGY